MNSCGETPVVGRDCRILPYIVSQQIYINRKLGQLRMHVTYCEETGSPLLRTPSISFLLSFGKHPSDKELMQRRQESVLRLRTENCGR